MNINYQVSKIAKLEISEIHEKSQSQKYVSSIALFHKADTMGVISFAYNETFAAKDHEIPARMYY